MTRYEVIGELRDGTLQVIDPATGCEVTARIEKDEDGLVTAIIIGGLPAMTPQASAKAHYKCPRCGHNHTVTVKATVKSRLTVKEDMTTSEAYTLEDVMIMPADEDLANVVRREHEANRSD